LIYREAFTTSAADQVIDHLVNDRGLQLDQEAERCSAPTTECRAERRSALAERCSALQGASAVSGKIVFVYHQARDTGYGARDTGLGVGDSGKVAVAPPASPGDQAGFPRRAA
jgi:hypothetical protein